MTTITETKSLIGTITKIIGSRVIIVTSTGLVYHPDIGTASLTRRNGAPMKFSELSIGDKVEIIGKSFHDNSFLAHSLRNLSLYAHNTTHKGKIATVAPTSSSLTLQSSRYGIINIFCDHLTTFKINNSISTFNQLKVGMTVTIKGTWERNKNDLVAKIIEAKLKLIDIEFIGQLVMKNLGGITVIVKNTIYGVDITKAKLQNKLGKSVGYDKFSMGDTVKVKGEHISGSQQIFGSIIKNTSILK